MFCRGATSPDRPGGMSGCMEGPALASCRRSSFAALAPIRSFTSMVYARFGPQGGDSTVGDAAEVAADQDPASVGGVLSILIH